MNRDRYINVDWVPVKVTNSGNRTFECNTLIFKNQGTQTVTIDGLITLNPGEGLALECYPGEMNIRAYDIVFVNDRAAGCNLIAVCKIYLNAKPDVK